ncbi:MobH family relaxase [Shewanella sp. UCD-KL12]|uniref:MobH family relaxase n=1 Tax=Shewanella sp. UCD-KL12 TaxID=1917163 RepID=UPI0009707735|nr:MobH family relaxase [Shewanella sp. UCD-KL12]
MIKIKMWSHNIKSKLQSSLTSLLKSDHISEMREDEAKLDALLHYPIKPAAIPLVSVESLYDRHKSKIIQIENNIGLVKTGSKYNSTEMVEEILKNFISYCHLFPASEMDHHQYVGGLLEHSLDVSLRSLQAAIGSMLDEQGLIDEDQVRRPRYEYAAWLCGLLHDAGKIISNLQIIEPKTGQQWQPLHSNLMDWAGVKSFTEYTVLHNKNRIHNEHETNSIHFLSLILNDTTKDYLLSGPDDLYSKITQTLIGYHSNKGYLFNAVRFADGASTYNDYARVWRHDSHRDKAMVTAVVDVLRSLYFDWTVNTPNSEMFILNGEIYLDMNKPIKAVIKKCQDLRIAVPNSPKSLIEILIEKRIIGKVSNKSTFGNFYCGKFSVDDIHQFNEHKSGPLASTSPKSVIKFVWANFAIGDNPIPDNANGALRYNTKSEDNVHTLFNGDKSIVVIQKPIVEDIDTAKVGLAKDNIKTKPSDSNSESMKTASTSAVDTNKELPVPTKVTTRKRQPKAKKVTNASAQSGDQSKLTESTPNKSNLQSSNEPLKQNAKNGRDVANELKPDLPGCESSTQEKSKANECGSKSDIKSPPWVIKRPVKAVDLALWELVSNRDKASATIENGFVVVSTKFLSEHLQQPIKSIQQEMDYLGLLIDTPKNFPKKVPINDILTKVIAISQSAAVTFTYLNIPLNNEIENVVDEHNAEEDKVKPTQSSKKPIVFVPLQTEIPLAQPQNVDIEQVEPNETSMTTTVQQSIVADEPLNTSHQLPDESKYLYQTLSTFVSSLQKDYPGVSASSLRPYLKTLNIKPTMDQSGTLMVSSTQTQRDELQYKIQKGITDGQ